MSFEQAGKHFVYYDATCSGWYVNHGGYNNVFEAEIFAKELVRRLGGQAKIQQDGKEIHLNLGHVGALETWGDGRGEFMGYRKPFDPKIHEYYGKRKNE